MKYKLVSSAILATLAVLWCSPLRAQKAAVPASQAPLTAPNLRPWIGPDDWPLLGKFREADAQLDPPARGENRVVFLGDSITEGWHFDEWFPGKPYINRGISGQTTPQLLLRFHQDVVDLHPRVVVILAGTNDIAENTGPIPLRAVEDNYAGMAEMAIANNIRVVFSSILPVYDYPWKPGIDPVSKIAKLNAWLKSYAAAHHLVYLDYFSAMQDARHGLPLTLSKDGVHPNKAGYAIMVPLVEDAITRASK